MQIIMEPIGFVRGARAEPVDDNWNQERAIIELDSARFGPEALLSLDAFSHAEIIFWFHHPEAATPSMGARRPRGRADWPLVGIFAQRAKNRPNRIGSTVCRILSVDGRTLSVAGLDAIDGTPVLDIKPYMTGFAPREEVREPGWSLELMAGYW